MKRIAYALLTTISAVVLVLSYHTSTEAIGTTDTTVSAPTSVSAPAKPTPSPSAASQTDSSGLRNGTFTGTETITRYGPVQVEVTVSNGKITKVSVPQYPNGSGRDQAINSRAVPALVKQTMSAQSKKVTMVSGATFTTAGYRKSLQSALDQAQA